MTDRTNGDEAIRRLADALRRAKAALVDMDGTLYDSMPGHARAWHELATETGIDSTVDEFFLYEGRTGASTINILFNRAFGRDATPDEARELYHRKTLKFAAMPPVDPMPGAQGLMKLLVERGVECVLVTGSGQNTLLNRLESDYPGIFPEERRITSRDVAHGKPHPEPYLKALGLAGVGADRAIAIENAPLGVESAVGAGVFTIAVTTGPIPRQAFVDAGADVIFDSMPDCYETIRCLLTD